MSYVLDKKKKTSCHKYVKEQKIHLVRSICCLAQLNNIYEFIQMSNSIGLSSKESEIYLLYSI